MNSQTENAIEILERLVAFDTTSRHSNLPLIDWVADHLNGLGIESRKVMSDDGRKANLVASIGGDQGGLVLSGHTDVVPVDGQDWATDPFRLTRKGDRLYGRGSADMKGFIACALAAAPKLKARNLSQPVHFAFSHDEEVGCLGTDGIIGDFAETGLRPDMCLVGEPTMMRVVNAQKGCAVFHTFLHGREVHSSQTDRGVNTVYYGAELVSFIARLAEERTARKDPLFDPPFTTVHVGLMHGGTAVNIVPNHCEIRWEYRAIPGDDGQDIRDRVQAFIDDDLLPRMRKAHPECSVETVTVAEVPGLSPEEDGAAEALIKRLVGRNDTEGVSYGTEGGFFQQAGMSTVICGPGDISVAHQPNEFIEVAQIDRCMDLMDSLTDHLSA